jgi:DNA-directed RNA polymerase subunit RPC12/RpoP
MAEIVRLECFSCGAPLSVDSRALDKGYICPHCGSKNYKPISFNEYLSQIGKSLETFDYSLHVEMGKLQDKIDEALENGEEKKALSYKRDLIFLQIKAASFQYKTDEQKNIAFDQMLYQWKREYLDPKGKTLKKKYEEAEKENDIYGFAKAMYQFKLHLQQGMPHMSPSWNPEETVYRVTKYSLDRFQGMTSEKKEKVMASIGFRPETQKEGKLYCSNCGAELNMPPKGTSIVTCPYCKSEIMVGTGLEGLSSLTGGSSATTSTQSEISVEEAKKKVSDFLNDMMGDDSNNKKSQLFNTSFVFKTCPQCGQAVQVNSLDSEIEHCPHCGYKKQ